MKRRTFVIALGSAALGAAACDDASRSLPGTTTSGATPLQPGASSVATRTDPFAIVQSSSTDLVRLAGGHSVELDVRSRSIRCFGTSGQQCWRLEGGPDGPLAGPVAALAWGDSLAVIDRSTGRVALIDESGRTTALLPNGEPLVGPQDGVVMADGRLLVADCAGNALVALSQNGTRETFVAEPTDGSGRFNGPIGLAVDSGGDIHVVNRGNARVFTFDARGTLVSAYGGTAEGMVGPRSVTVDSRGRAFVADPLAGAVFVYEGGRQVDAWRPTLDNGFAASPTRVRIESDGTLFVVLANA